jgi:Transcriptional regulator, AbiEi antitoxin
MGEVLELAARQHGVVTGAQLVALGLSRGGIEHRARRGRLFRVHRNVYAIGSPTLTREGRWMAAVLACGPDAVLSQESAAALWGSATASAKSRCLCRRTWFAATRESAHTDGH